ncbi:MAG: hypothetical protein JWL81_2154, partial [Verrucomicrobiales bacterium]|nr:hypothetical protein [Verrucomicrobiales bacterium]
MAHLGHHASRHPHRQERRRDWSRLDSGLRDGVTNPGHSH